MNSEKYTGVDSGDGPGPQKSIEGYIICLTGLHEEVIILGIYNPVFIFYLE